MIVGKTTNKRKDADVTDSLTVVDLVLTDDFKILIIWFKFHSPLMLLSFCALYYSIEWRLDNSLGGILAAKSFSLLTLVKLWHVMNRYWVNDCKLLLIRSG